MSEDPFALPHLCAELMAMAAEDLRVRQELEDAGKLGDGYSWPMEIVHRANATRLRQVITQYGWPGRSLVGEDGAEAAWLIVQHSIGEPEFQRECVALLESCVASGEVPAWQLAYLLDRIAYFEGRPQRYGTHTDYDDEGYMVLCPLEDGEHVNELRAAIGLGPIQEHVTPREHQTPIPREKVRQQRSEFEEWARRVGWRK
jgi:hypothetical protein